MPEKILRKNSIPTQESLELIDTSFPGSEKNQYMLFDFPAWSIQSPYVHFFSEWVDGKIASLCGLYESEYLYEGKKIKTGFIGAVCTDKNFRGQGLAKKVIQQAILFAQSKKLATLFLWGSEYKLYQPFGFELCGEQIRFYIKSLPSSEPLELEFDEEIVKNFHPFILEKIQSRNEGVIWDERRLQTLHNQKSTQWVVLKKNEKVIAYCGFDRGMDLKNIIHEWWGEDSQSLKKLLYVLSQTNPELQIIGSRKELEKYTLFSDSIVEEFLCMALVLDPYPWIKASGKKLDYGVIQNEDHSWTLTDFKSEKLIHLNHQDFTRFLFGPQSIEQSHIMEPLNIHLWFWGLDSL